MFDPHSIATDAIITGPIKAYILSTGNSLTYFDTKSIEKDAITICINATIGYYPKCTYAVIGDAAIINKYKSKNTTFVISKAREFQFKPLTDSYIKIDEIMQMPSQRGGGYTALAMSYILYRRIPTLESITIIGLDYSFYYKQNKDYTYASVLKKHLMPAQIPICTPTTGDEETYKLRYISEYSDYMRKVTGRRYHYSGQIKRCLDLVKADPGFASTLIFRNHFNFNKATLGVPNYGWERAKISIKELKGLS